MRYSTSMLAAIAVSFITFLGMAFLVSSPTFKKSKDIQIVSFSSVPDMDEPEINTPTPATPPKPIESLQQPTAPKIDITSTDNDRSEFFPNPNNEVTSLPFPTSLMPTFKPGAEGKPNGVDGDLTQLFMIQPMYPIDAARNKIEGWVKVEFTVTASGIVTDAKIIDAKPKRIFNRATLRALQKSKFKPLIVDGVAVAQKAVQVIEFKLKKL